MAAAPEVKFGEWIQKGLDVYKNNFGILLIVHLITLVLGSVSLGIVAGPLMVGVVLIVLRIMDGSDPKPQVGDLFEGFSFFVNAFLLFLVLFAAGFVGSSLLGPLSPVFSLVVSAFLMFSLFLIADQGMAFWPAVVESFNKVKTNFFPLLGLSVVASLISSVGLIACFVGFIFTFPIYTCIIAVAYREVYGKGHEVAAGEGDDSGQ